VQFEGHLEHGLEGIGNLGWFWHGAS